MSLGSSGTIFDHLWDHLGSSGIIWDHLGSSKISSGIIWDHLRSSGLRSSGIISSGIILGSSWDHLELFRIICNHLGSSWVIWGWDHLRSLRLGSSGGIILDHLCPAEQSELWRLEIEPWPGNQALEAGNRETASISVTLSTKVCFWCRKSKKT